jgi:hypothetical protein
MPGKRCFGSKAVRMTAGTELSISDRLPKNMAIVLSAARLAAKLGYIVVFPS